MNRSMRDFHKPNDETFYNVGGQIHNPVVMKKMMHHAEWSIS